MNYYLTREAFTHLLAIEEWSLRHFGSAQTERYMNEIYRGFERAANQPSADELRQERSRPFLMQPAGANHFAVYQRFSRGIIIAAVFHQKMDIEKHLSTLETMLAKDIEETLLSLDDSSQ